MIAQAGIASRRKAEELIQQGKVKVNGKNSEGVGNESNSQDKVEVNNIPLEKEEPVYFFTI